MGSTCHIIFYLRNTEITEMNYRKYKMQLWRHADVMLTSARPLPADGARVDLQSEAPVGGRTRTRARSTPRVAGDLKEAAPLAIGRWSFAGDEARWRPGQVVHGGGAREREGERRGHREDRELTAELVQWSAMAGRPRRRRIDDERAPKVG
jgi:hypothetical protein